RFRSTFSFGDDLRCRLTSSTMCGRRNEVMSALRHLAATLLLATVVAGGGAGENPAPALDDSPTSMALASNRAPAKGTSTVTLPATTTATVGTPLQLVAQ